MPDTNAPPSPSVEQIPQVSHISLKLPPFWPGRVVAWFAQAEANFEISGIKTDNTKYNHVLSVLPERVAADIEDILIDPPKENKYIFLKSELIRRLSASEEKRVNQLLSDVELGERKPSQFLRHLRSLAGSSLQDESILRQLWLRRLPQQVQAILAAQADLPLQKVAELADRIVEVSPIAHSVFAANASVQDDPLQAINNRLDQLAKQVAAISSGRSRHRNNRSISRNRSKSSDRSVSDLCWYHRRFKSKANRCTKPCSWTPAENLKDNTGSDICCYPKSAIRGKLDIADYELKAANGSTIKTYGLLNLSLNLGLRRDFRWSFVIAEVGTAIIGSDFLAHYNLLPDCTNRRLVDAKTGLSSRGSVATVDQASVRAVIDNHSDSIYLKILMDFPDITRPPGVPREVKHDTVHRIITTDGPPVAARPRRLAPRN
ncbi:unnamed protein product [Euphydryas editha]|uniref:DUF7041 domain-containing protein n=1 Tax=Euphydryas editha TaxID=104508 RepID=A0AAU9UR17_EUPED|nr:unnamed protein product [Euphydryas editha]